MRAIRTQDFIKIAGLKRNYIIPGVLPETGRIALYGAPKKGKSFLALQLALAVCQGTPFLGMPVKIPGPVLYLQFDTPPELWQDRLIKLHEADIPIDGQHGLYVLHPDTQPKRVNILHGQDAVRVREMVTATMPILVIVDVLRKLHNLKENESDDMKTVVDQLETLFHGRALLIVHHTPKPNTAPGATRRSPSEAGRGSNYLGGEVDANWLLEPRSAGGVTLCMETRFASPTDELCLKQGPSGLWTPYHPVPGRPPLQMPKAIQIIHEHRDKGFTACQTLALAEGISQSTFERAWSVDLSARESVGLTIPLDQLTVHHTYNDKRPT